MVGLPEIRADTTEYERTVLPFDIVPQVAHRHGSLAAFAERESEELLFHHLCQEREPGA